MLCIACYLTDIGSVLVTSVCMHHDYEAHSVNQVSVQCIGSLNRFCVCVLTRSSIARCGWVTVRLMDAVLMLLLLLLAAAAALAGVRPAWREGGTEGGKTDARAIK